MEAAVGLRPEHVDAVSFTHDAEGRPGAARSAPDQREVLRALLDVYVGRVPEELADAEAAKYADDHALDELSFAWAGGLEPGQPHYYRVHGGTLLAEYDNTQRGVNHVHTVWRDLARLRTSAATCWPTTTPTSTTTTDRRPDLDRSVGGEAPAGGPGGELRPPAR